METALLLPGSVEAGAAFAEGTIIGSVTAKVFPDTFAFFAEGVVVVDGLGAVRIQSFG